MSVYSNSQRIRMYELHQEITGPFSKVRDHLFNSTIERTAYVADIILPKMITEGFWSGNKKPKFEQGKSNGLIWQFAYCYGSPEWFTETSMDAGTMSIIRNQCAAVEAGFMTFKDVMWVNKQRQLDL